MTKIGCFDFETTSTSLDTTSVVQVAFVVQDVDLDRREPPVERRAEQVLCYVPAIPIGATAVHGIRAEDVLDRHPFDVQVGALVKMLARCDYVVTFNGTGFDVPILERYAVAAGLDVSFVRSWHVDVYRAWRRRQLIDARAACYSGSLAGAHLYYTSETFDGAHDARVDCRATLRVLWEQLASMSIADLVRWSSLPLPGYADMTCTLQWVGDVLTLGIGEYAGHDIAQVDAGFLRWMLGKDFAEDTKAIVQQVLDGGYPARRYEDEIV